MPELPEVETLRRNLEATLVGRRFASVSITKPNLFVGCSIGAPEQLGPNSLIGKRIERIRRRAKFLIFDLSEDLALVLHLRLSGQLVHRSRDGVALATGGHPVPAFGAPLPHKAT